MATWALRGDGIDERDRRSVRRCSRSVTGLDELLTVARRSFIAEGPPDVALRRNRIDRLLAMILDNSEEFVAATAADYGSRSRSAAFFAEILGMLSVIEHTRAHVPRWMRATKLMRTARFAGLRAEVLPSPLGVIGDHRSVELPGPVDSVAGGGGIRRGQPGDDQDVGGHPATAELMAATAPRYFDTDRTAGRDRRTRGRRGVRRPTVRPPVLHRLSLDRGAGGRARRRTTWFR